MIGILRIFSLFILWAVASYSIGCATTNSLSPAKEKSATIVAGFPKGYQDWANPYSKTVLDKTSPFYGFQRVLVSEIALPAYKKGGQYPEGSRLVLEFNEPVREGPEGDIIKGGTNWIAVMRKDETATKTGGWVFAAYDGKTKALKTEVDPVKSCYSCHTARENNNYIFSKYAD